MPESTPDIIVSLDAAFWGTVAAIVALLVASAFFSGSETALTAASRGKLRAQSDRGSGSAKRALRVTANSEKLIGSVLLGNNIVNILSAALATALFTRLFGDSGVALATLVMTALVLVFSEVLPKTYAITNPERAAKMVATPISVVILVLAPIVGLVSRLVRAILRIFGVDADPSSPVLSVHEEISGAIRLGHSAGAVGKEHRDRLLGALDLGHRTVEEIMLHRSAIEMVDSDAPADEILRQCVASVHSRLPVYRGERDNIIGVIHAKTLLRAIAEATEGAAPFDDLATLAMPPYFIPETTALDDQMREFLRRHSHFALIVDEYGVLQGLITLEDILEEIVGQIRDESDPDAATAIVRSDDGNYHVDGAMTIRDLNRATDWNLPDAEANTLAGLVIHEAQAIPAVGQVFNFHGFRWEIVARKDNRITKLLVRPL